MPDCAALRRTDPARFVMQTRALIPLAGRSEDRGEIPEVFFILV